MTIGLMAGKCSRLSHLPSHLQSLIRARLSYSTASSSPYSFPSRPHPTPHEIFHLPRGASQADVRRRYLELVKLHHPDSQLARDLPAAERHRRFQMVSSAYDVLRLKRERAYPERDSTMWEEIDRRKRAHYRHSRRAEYERAEWKNPQMDDRWTDRVILAFGFVALVTGLIPVLMHPRPPLDRSTSAFHLAEARREARLMYDDRVRELARQATDETRPDSK
ncbi:hypothetical protein DFH07DRAFT_793606 [Mycena maculata]|uniref:J domain-containing protein n=1 Tax=Mycena maculata TaxID=230809 RepID=A0AAD7K9M1_9AGAR|nr:hypothetical protein DFH07DRAFT_793606 [Mycena maculata]